MADKKSPSNVSAANTNIHASGLRPTKNQKKQAKAAAKSAASKNNNVATKSVGLISSGPFIGVYNKDLAGVTLTWTGNRVSMSKQYNQFEFGVINAAGKQNSDITRSLEEKRTLTLLDFKPEFIVLMIILHWFLFVKMNKGHYECKSKFRTLRSS
jgi:hypothetical protein